MQLLARVVFPRTIEPRTGQPLTALVSGAMYTRPGQWERLTLVNVREQVEQQARILRAQLRTQVETEQVFAALGLADETSMVGFDIEAARERIESIPWILSASIQKLLPSTLVVTVVEHAPFALWQREVGGSVAIVDRDGIVVDELADARFAALPLVVGPGADQRAHEIVEALATAPALAAKVRAAVLVSERRWDLLLANGVRILLPEVAPERAINEIARLDATNGLLSLDVVQVDLRLPDKLVVRMSPGAAALAQARLTNTGVTP
jgi:cell division protein FtsQ